MVRRRGQMSKASYKNKMRSDYQREAMLDLRSLTSFKYHLKHILEESSMNEDFQGSFSANLITKASRGSLKEAKDYARSIAGQGMFKEETSEAICDLLERYRRYR